MLRHLFILLAVVPSFVRAADTDATKHLFEYLADCGTNRDATKHFEDYLARCGTNKICCVWFLHDNPKVGMVMLFDIQDETVFTTRDVPNWALQNSDLRRLTHSQVLSLQKIAGQMPPSDKTVGFSRAVSVSMRREGKVEIFHYDRRHAPAVIQRLYDIGGGYFDDGKGT
jgi:hypothetical protein